MYATCLFCYAALGSNESIEHFPIGRRLAFDASRGRLWVVCGACGRWNLSPLDERWEAIEECERVFRGTRVRVTTTHIGLARLAEGCELVRIGAPLRPEFAAWRYGRRFTRRRAQTRLVVAATTAAAGVAALAAGPLLAPAMAMGAISIVVVPGLTSALGVVPVISALAVRDYLENERVLGRLTRHRTMSGREHSDIVTVRAKHVAAAQFQVSGGDPADVSLDIPHDSGWAHFEGIAAMQAASLLLASVNRHGATQDAVDDAVKRVEELGDASSYLQTAAALGNHRNSRMTSLLNSWRGLGAMHLSGTEALAMEMSLNEESERRALEGELAILEAAWRDAEEVARVADRL